MVAYWSCGKVEEQEVQEELEEEEEVAAAVS